MIAKFEVKNFKNFNDWFSFDLTDTKQYAFKPECVSNSIVSKALIYGPNGVGKSNLGFAMLDITMHLKDRPPVSKSYDNYLPIGSKEKLAEFKYYFVFGEDEVTYKYGKSNWDELIYESLAINSQVVLQYDRRGEERIATIELKGTELLKKDMGDSQISLITYVRNSSILDENKQNELFKKFLKQVDGILFFRALGNELDFIGTRPGFTTLGQYLAEEGEVGNLEEFLQAAGIACKLELVKNDGKSQLLFVSNNKKVPFVKVASTGTVSLCIFYLWFKQLESNPNISFIFIDEFDAFYHHDLSKLVVNSLVKLPAQVILTTHNTSIMSNDILRPDCYFLMGQERIHSLANRTPKELRSAHNIEKMYRAGAFNG